RSSGASILGKSSSLSPRVLHALTNYIDDEDQLVRQSVFTALKNQSVFPPDIIHRAGLRFFANDRKKREQTFELLHSRDEFYRCLSNFDWQAPQLLLSRKSTLESRNHIHFYKSLVVYLPDTQKTIPILFMIGVLSYSVLTFPYYVDTLNTCLSRTSSRR
ncbi:hypothetical protein DPV78_000503, partial [Talaromyces pinophilus]